MEPTSERRLPPNGCGVLVAAGALAEPEMRALDAIHITAGADLAPIDAFVSYDERQSAAARLAGLRTVGPGPEPCDIVA